MKYAPPRIWNMEVGARRAASANGRSLIYEPGAAPPPCHNRVPGARARLPPPAARRCLALSRASDGETRARPQSLSAPQPVPHRASECSRRTRVNRVLVPAPPPLPGHAPALSAATMPRVKPACVRRVSIGT